MKEGAAIGGLIAFMVYLLLPIYADNGQPASIFPTANVVSDSGSFTGYVNNLPLSMIVFFALELLGISIGITAQIVLGKASQKGLNTK